MDVMLGQMQQNGAHADPYLEITEQPKARGQRFRYKCEGRSAGSIPGEHSTNEHKTYPSIKIHNYDGPAAIVVVSCVTKDNTPRPHPHSLVGQDCNKGVCTIKLRGTNIVSFPNIGIQCATRKEVQDHLQKRKEIRVDPFGTGYFNNVGSIDLNAVCLCFQVFLPDDQSKFTRVVRPIVSQCIYDKKAVNDLVICRLSRQAGSAKGGDEVILLCEKVTKDDIQVRFYEENNLKEVIWEEYGEFAPADIHRQFAIVFKTPCFRDPYIRDPAQVFVQLRRPSDEETSDSKPFQFIPDDPDPYGISAKKRRKTLMYNNFNDSPMATESMKEESMSVKDRLKLHAHRKKPAATAANSLTPYSFDNTGGASAVYVLPQQDAASFMPSTSNDPMLTEPTTSSIDQNILSFLNDFQPTDSMSIPSGFAQQWLTLGNSAVVHPANVAESAKTSLGHDREEIAALRPGKSYRFKHLVPPGHSKEAP
ncbi:hypothetical protein CAPTEDRAFT_220294 [Capitella teleta]|uniref:RHD domain-containing protein n=1 Tax=Capitella teleta TaxID=283909 RepID=R7UMR8_CAPTE|nr:hypothetical protein CAPTEDRAFT_220294 [Capitella teleta]|eukprot:ELU04547.1 hypothetical protein CAPTEDRAFT_220294 [Capitella teleta]